MMARPRQKKRLWTDEEDRVLFECKRANMNLRWPDIAKLTGLGRDGKSCRERYKNHLDPEVKRGEFSKWEDDFIIRFQSLNKWASIAKLLGRTDNDVKNHWNNHLDEKKKLGKSTADQPHIDPNASSSSIPTLVSASQEIASTWFTSELPPLDSELMSTVVSASQEIASTWFTSELPPLDCELMSTEEVNKCFFENIYMHTFPFC